jgi:hypothetical protein
MTTKKKTPAKAKEPAKKAEKPAAEKKPAAKKSAAKAAPEKAAPEKAAPAKKSAATKVAETPPEAPVAVPPVEAVPPPAPPPPAPAPVPPPAPLSPAPIAAAPVALKPTNVAIRPPVNAPLLGAAQVQPAAPLGPQPDGVQIMQNYAWENYGTNLATNVATRYRLSNGRVNDANVGLEAIRWAVEHCAQNGGNASISGSTWSFSPVAMSARATFDITFMAKQLAFDPSSLANPGELPSLVQVQGGTMIQQLIAYAENAGRDLLAMGGNCGQTVAGAVSTGTHGGFIGRPGFPDMVRALYVVGEDGHRHWFERASKPVISDARKQVLQAANVSVHQDDNLFNHAVVSLGAFGLIYSVTLETAPTYSIKLHRKQQDFDDALDRATFDRDFSAYGPQPVIDFATVVNPFQMQLQNGKWRGKSCAAPTVVWPSNVPPVPPEGGGVQKPLNDQDLAPLLAAAITAVPAAIPPLVAPLMQTLYGDRDAEGIMSVAYPLSLTHAPTVGMEIGCPGANARELFGVILDWIQRKAPRPLPGVLAIRQTPKSAATFSIAQFDPTTTFEFACLKVNGIEQLLGGLLDTLEAQPIPFTLHLGMLHGQDGAGQPWLTPIRFRKMFGATNVNNWIAARIITCPDGAVFSTATTRALGLTS